MSASMENVVDLGFVEKADSERLLSHYFPSKIGGKPSWLALRGIPDCNRLKCGCCEKTCLFLLQVYANLDEKVDCFHRTIFLFICKDPNCYSNSKGNIFHAFRSQLPKVNEYYSESPPEYLENTDEQLNQVDKYEKLCTTCGCHASKTCAKCHSVSYCSKKHQAIDWKQSHKNVCGKENSGGEKSNIQSLLFPEYELVTEEENYEDTKPKEKTQTEAFTEYQQYLKTSCAKGTMENIGETDLNAMAKHEEEEDKVFKRFKTRISHEPEQVLRYDRGGEPLWVSGEGKPTEIPNCSCGAPRQMEFQVMPQLLRHLKVDSVEASIDWGTVVVYTCTNSCQVDKEYMEEYVWKQDFSNTSNPT